MYMEKIKRLLFSGNYQSKAIQGVSWLGGLKVFTRIISIGRISILARLLMPSQFGVYGIASLIVALLETVTETGVNVFLVQEKDDIDKLINTAWVISIIRGLIIAFLVFATAPFVAEFFGSTESENLIRVISIVPLLRGFINPSVAKFQKYLNFGMIFKVSSIATFVDTIGTIFFTYITHSPLGIVIGMIISVIVEIVLTFRWASPKPKLSFKKKLFKKIIKKGKWVTGSHILNYLSNQGDDAVVGKILNTTSLGLYQVAYRLSLMPGTEITSVASDVTFPIFTMISADKERLRKAFKKMFLSVVFIVTPISLVIFVFPYEIIMIFLGNQWVEAANVLRVLIIYGLVVAINRTKNSVFLALNKQDQLFRFQLIRFSILALAIVPLTTKYGIVGAGIATVISSLIVTPIAFIYLYKILK